MPLGDIISIGRSSGAWSVPWDEHISRQHIEVRWDHVALHVEALPGTSNPVFYQGSEAQTFSVRPGEHFVIGQTTFTLTEESVTVAIHVRPPVTERTFSHEYLRHLRFRDPGDRLEIISKLPERIAITLEFQGHVSQAVNIVREGTVNRGTNKHQQLGIRRGLRNAVDGFFTAKIRGCYVTNIRRVYLFPEVIP